MAAIKKGKPARGSQAETATVESSGLVRMRLDDSEREGYTGPTTADVHPDEVENWKAGGWVIDQQSEGHDDAKTPDSNAAAADDASTAAVADVDPVNGAASDSDEAGG
jgi:hypothetical protein